MSRPIYIDITELARNPVRTGIQRVVRQLLRNWPVHGQLIPCIFDALRTVPVVLAVEAYELLLDADEAVRRRSPKEIAAAVEAVIAAKPVVPVPYEQATIFLPEVFFERLRAKFYAWFAAHTGDRLYALAYDFIPYLEPELIGVKRGGQLMYYLQVIQTVSKIGFISARTRNDYSSRIVRDLERGGPVFPLGADAWTAQRQRFSSERRAFVCLGSIDGRKNQHLIVRAFRQMWADGLDADLVMIGDFFETKSGMAQEIMAAKEEPRFSHFTSIPDEEIAALMQRARATLYLSSVEGYGLPPVESLASGVPVIAAASVPSVAELAPAGHIRIHETSPASIADAVLRMMDDAEASRLWDEAAGLVLPTWTQTAAEIAQWLEA